MIDLVAFKPKFDKVFSSFFDSKLDTIEEVSPHARKVLETSRDMWTKGGKRIRPYLSVVAYQGHGGVHVQEMIYASCALELLHVFALVHDDIIDQSDTRRGFKTLHVLLRDEHECKKLYGDPKHVGESLAILIGDLLFSYANEIVTTIQFPSEQVVAAQKLFYTIQQQLVLGEYQDVQTTAQLDRVTEEEVIQLMSRKSGRYSIEQPLQFGTVLAGKTIEYAKGIFQSFSVPLGIAFQLHDDMLGTFGDEKRIGKPTDSDIKQGKPTLMVIHALRHADPKTKKRLLSLLGNQRITTHEVEEVRNILRLLKSDDYAKRRAHEYVSRAQEALQSIQGVPQDFKQALLSLTEYIVSRTN